MKPTEICTPLNSERQRGIFPWSRQLAKRESKLLSTIRESKWTDTRIGYFLFFKKMSQNIVGSTLVYQIQRIFGRRRHWKYEIFVNPKRSFSEKPSRIDSPTTFDLQKSIQAALKRRNDILLNQDSVAVGEIQSLAASRYFDQHKADFISSYPEIKGRLQSDYHTDQGEPRESPTHQLPLSTVVKVDSTTDQQSAKQTHKRYSGNDRGFYVRSSAYVDEYKKGTTDNLPASEIIHTLTRGKPRPVKATKQFKVIFCLSLHVTCLKKCISV